MLHIHNCYQQISEDKPAVVILVHRSQYLAENAKIDAVNLSESLLGAFELNSLPTLIQFDKGVPSRLT